MASENGSWSGNLLPHAWLAVLIVGLMFLLPLSEVRTVAVPTGFTDTLVAGGLVNATAMEIAPDGRIFVCQQGGALRVIKNGALLTDPFVTLSVDQTGERGLLGVAFDPDFTNYPYVYVYYTVPGTTAHNRVSRFTASGDTAVADSEEILIELDDLSGATNHNGGAIHFGLDNKLYIALGENANPALAQVLTSLHGKILRINPDGTIPTNPFDASTTGNRKAIWARGLRNPFTFSFQPGTGRMFINDVGQGTWEEINDGIAGSNYGWNTCEGVCNPPNVNLRDPIYAYLNDASTCAITGGTFYNPVTVQFPSTYAGRYFFSDLCGGWIKVLDPANGNTVSDFATGISLPVDLKVASNGTLYYLSRGSGAVRRINYPANMIAPTITPHPLSQSVNPGGSVTFTVGATGTAPFSYQWQKNNTDINGATSSSYTFNGAQGSDNGTTFRAIVTNAFGAATSNPATLTVTAGCSYAISPSTRNFSAKTASGSVAVTATAGCGWNVSNSIPWVQVTSSTSGIGNGQVDFNVLANAGVRRSAQMTIAGQTLAVSQGASFLDLALDHPFYEEIGKVSAAGITLGCDVDGLMYCADAVVTREQMAAFIIRALGEFNPPQPSSQRFVDVPPSNPFYAFIEDLAVRGVTLGCNASGPLYCPAGTVTREQMAAFIIRALGTPSPPPPASQRFVDVPPANIFYAFIEEMALRSITLGCNATGPLYCPGSDVTRGQMAAFLTRAFNL